MDFEQGIELPASLTQERAVCISREVIFYAKVDDSKALTALDL